MELVGEGRYRLQVARLIAVLERARVSLTIDWAVVLVRIAARQLVARGFDRREFVALVRDAYGERAQCVAWPEDPGPWPPMNPDAERQVNQLRGILVGEGVQMAAPVTPFALISAAAHLAIRTGVPLLTFTPLATRSFLTSLQAAQRQQQL
jgi:hypothetical protein